MAKDKVEFLENNENGKDRAFEFFKLCSYLAVNKSDTPKDSVTTCYFEKIRL